MIDKLLRRRARPNDQKGSRGQVLALFAITSILLIGVVAVVIDVAWFWTNEQAMQKAADAGALAGAVYLPGDVPRAYSAAAAEARKNGYATGTNGVVVNAAQDSSNRRRLKVTITSPVQAYFARVFCAVTTCTNQINETVVGTAEFTLPVPMGSPQNYYGVGPFVYNKVSTQTTGTSGTTGWRPEGGAVSGGGWSSPTNAALNDGSDTTATSDGDQQQWNTFGLLSGSGGVPNDATLMIDGLEVQLANVYLTGTGTSTNCTLRAEVSWNSGASWSTAQTTSALDNTKTTVKTLGGPGSTAGWGVHVWQRADFSDTSFRVRLTWYEGNSQCASSATVYLDQLLVRVTYHTGTTTTTTTIQTGAVTGPTGATLPSQGFWGAVITRGGSRENGDQFSPVNDNAGISGHTATNPEFDAGGYDYTVVLNGGNGSVAIFDATFCETGSNGGGGNMGTGDHWIAGAANPVTTVYQLWNENGTPYDTNDDLFVASSGSTFANERQADYSGVMGSPAHTGLTNCASNPYHNAWYTLAGNLPAGRYRVNVNTSSTNNGATNAENMWSLWVSGGTTPQVFGEGKMAAYNNLVSGNQLFYLAQIGAENAGKTMVITLFDPGDVGGNAFLKIRSPNGNSYNYATFSWWADNGTSGTNVTSIQTASSGGSFFNDRVITIDVALPSSYGSGGLTPAGETQPGWWKIEYQVSGGNDTTTWQVSIRGSPVHLIVP